MATYYVRGYAEWDAVNPDGDDGNDGSSLFDAKATLASLSGTLASGDIVYFSGINFSDPDAPFYIDGLTGFTLAQSSNPIQGHVHGGVRAPMSGWTSSGGGLYSINVGAGKTIAGVTVNYHTSEDANGMRRAWLRKCGVASSGATFTNASWTNSTKRVTVSGGEAGAFTNIATGDAIYLDAGTGVTARTYHVAEKVSNDVVALDVDINGTSGDIASGVGGGVAAPDAVDWTWHYNSGTGLLTINVDTLDPNAGAVITYVALTGTNAKVNNLNGFYAEDSTRVVVSGLEFSGFIGQLGSTTYYCNGVQFYTCDDSTVSHCDFWDNGIHAVSIAGLSSLRNSITNCNAYGLYSRYGTAADGGNQYVFYSGGGNVTGCRGMDNTAYVSHVLDPNGYTHNNLVGMGGYFSHTDGAGGRVVSDVEWRNCTLTAAMPEVQPPFSLANFTTPSDGTKWENYPVRMIDCTITATNSKLVFGSPVAFRRCRFDITAPAQDVNFTGYQHNAGSAGYTTFHESCDFTFRMGSNVGYQGFNSANNWTHYLYNCSFLLIRTGTTEAYFFSYNSSASNTIVARNCIFSDASSSGTVYVCVGDGTASAARHDFKNCAYFNIDLFSVNTSFDTAAEWRSNVDTVAQNAEPWFPASQPFASATSASHDLLKTSGLFKNPRPYLVFPRTGINNLGFSGHIGAWQYGNQSALPRPRVHRHRHR